MGRVEFIAHRGNTDGPNATLENSPDYVDAAIDLGFSVEVDIRKIGDLWFLGHDYPKYPVSSIWLDERKDRLILHLKNVEAAKSVNVKWHSFCHTNDPFTITSRGKVWIHDLSLMPDGSCIVPLLTRDLVTAYPNTSVGAVCSDYRIGEDGKVYNVPRGTL